MEDGFTIFLKKYGGIFAGLLIGLVLGALMIFTNFYKVIFAIAIVIACMYLGAYVQRNKDMVKEKTKKFIDKL